MSPHLSSNVMDVIKLETRALLKQCQFCIPPSSPPYPHFSDIIPSTMSENVTQALKLPLLAFSSVVTQSLIGLEAIEGRKEDAEATGIEQT